MDLSVASMVERAALWPLRVLWLAVPLVAGLGFDDLLEGLRYPLVAELVLWVGWFAGLVATLAPGPISLTGLRILAPAVAAVALLGGLLSGQWPTSLLVFGGYGLVVTVVALLAHVGDHMINGSAYGSERRMALRPPGYAVLGPIQVAWVLVLIGLALPVILVADARWITAAVVIAPSAVAVWLGWRVLHQLSRRWLVFVPAGFVIHDPLQVGESILMQRSIVESLGPAVVGDVDDNAEADLSGGASGLALEAVLKEPVPFSRRARNELHTAEADRIQFTPSLPGAVLREARIRAIRITAPA